VSTFNNISVIITVIFLRFINKKVNLFKHALIISIYYMRKIYYVILALGALLNSNLFSQADSAGYIKYNPQFRFRDGIFINFDQVKNNSPIPKSRIISPAAYDDQYFYDRTLQSKQINYYDNFGVKQEVPTKKIWGYSQNGSLYVNINEGFYRINILGSICHFVANYTSYNNTYPYSYYDYRYNPYGGRTGSYSTTEMRQYLLDFVTGNILDYNVASVELLLMRDPELYDEYVSLRNKKKKQLKFLYIRKFNEKHPLYFPIK
jgi:hypothetical protein